MPIVLSLSSINVFYQYALASNGTRGAAYFPNGLMLTASCALPDNADAASGPGNDLPDLP
jgi:hypothetical protein